jgi:hypothetical protein
MNINFVVYTRAISNKNQTIKKQINPNGKTQIRNLIVFGILDL